MQLYARLKTRFRCGSLPSLTSQHTVTRWLILQKARRHTTKVLRLLVGTRFQVLFHSPLGVLFTFPSRYWFTIGHRRVFSLREWSPWIHTGFHVSGITRVPNNQMPDVSCTGLLPCLVGISIPLPLQRHFVTGQERRGSLEIWPHNTTCSNVLTLTHTWV